VLNTVNHVFTPYLYVFVLPSVAVVPVVAVVPFRLGFNVAADADDLLQFAELCQLGNELRAVGRRQRILILKLGHQQLQDICSLGAEPPREVDAPELVVPWRSSC